MNNNPMPDTVFEALFRQAVIDDFIDEVESAPSRAEIAKLYPISPEFDLRMKKVFDRVRRKDFIISFTRHAKKVAVILIIVSNVFFAVLLTSPEVRAAISNVVVEWFEKFTAIIYNSEKTEEDRTEKHFRPQFLPDGYSESEATDFENIMLVIYSKGKDDIIRFSYSIGDDVTIGVSVDNENSEVEETIINGEKALIVTALDGDGQNGVIFKIDGYVFTLWGNVSVDMLLLITDSIVEIQ